jgi:hypothetical protein
MSLSSSGLSSINNPRRRALRRGFWVGVILMVAVIVVTAHPQYPESILGAVLVIVASLLPSWIWLSGRVEGLPLFPIFAATHLETFGFPLLYEHPIVMLFPANNQLVGAITVTGFLLLGTIVWYVIGLKPARPIGRCLVLNPAGADFFLLTFLAAGIIVNMGESGAWFPVSPEVFSIIRAISLALEALACFVLSFELGNGSLSTGKQLIFIPLILGLIISTLPGLLLIDAMSIAVIAGLGFVLGAGKFPWRVGLVALCFFAFFHAGKAEMREYYWREEEDPVIQPSSYPRFIAEWAQISTGNILAGKSERGEEEQTLLERASLMQLLLYMQVMVPTEVSYMNGETYAIIPSLLVPRIFNPSKPASHEGTYRLNIHYGFQTREATAHNTIGFGLLNESFANFGYVGVTLLALVLASYYAAVARWASTTPVLSFRSLFGILVTSYSFQVEYSAGVYVSALFQSTCALLVVAALFMRRMPVHGLSAPIVAQPMNTWQRVH